MNVREVLDYVWCMWMNKCMNVREVLDYVWCMWMSKCMNVREVPDYVVVYVDEYVYESDRGSRLCGHVCG